MLALAGVASVTRPTIAQEEPQLHSPNTMTVLGSGEYKVRPEYAEISAFLTTRGATIAEARDPHPAIAAAVREAIESLASKGLVLESSRYSLREVYPFRYSLNATEEQLAKVTYEATTSFALSTRNLENLAEALSKLAQEDLRIGQIWFAVDNPRFPLLEARKSAAHDAHEQALAYAEALGVKLVEIRSVTDGEARPVSRDGEADMTPMIGPDGEPLLSIVVPDALTYVAQVNVTWTIASEQ